MIKVFKSEQWLKKQLQSKAMQNSMRPLAEANANRRLESVKNRLIQDVRNHPVSLEIEEGPDAEESIAVLSSHEENGNIFSAIGFDSTDQPVEKLVDFLDQFITKLGSPTTRVSHNNFVIYYTWNVFVPDKSDFDSEETLAFPDGYQGGSWVNVIEDGNLIGMNSYLHDSTREFAASRSGPAIQAKTRSGSAANIGTRHFVKNNYMSPLLKKFVKNLRTGL